MAHGPHIALGIDSYANEQAMLTSDISLSDQSPTNAPGSGSAIVPLRSAQETGFWHAKQAKSAPKTRFSGPLSPV
jgi:hypothetical protein